RRERPARRSRKNRGRPPLLLGLAPGGVCPAAAVAGGAVRSYRTISPLPPAVLRRPGLAVCFCGTFPGVAPAGRYPAPCFRGARTFLPPLARRAAIRPSGGPKISGVRREKSNAMNEISAVCLTVATLPGNDGCHAAQGMPGHHRRRRPLRADAGDRA